MPISPAKRSGSLIHQREFPNIDLIAANTRMVITRSWALEYQSLEEVLRHLNETSYPKY
jgi:hypothetical protein